VVEPSPEQVKTVVFLDSLPLGQAVTAYPEVRFPGRLDFIACTVDEETRTTHARIVVTNPDERLLPGMFANGEIVVGNRAPVLTTPRSAVQRDDAKRIYFVEMAPSRGRN